MGPQVARVHLKLESDPNLNLVITNHMLQMTEQHDDIMKKWPFSRGISEEKVELDSKQDIQKIFY